MNRGHIMEFGFKTFDEFMSFVKTEGREISNWSAEKVDKFNNHVWKLQENKEFNEKYEAWVEEVIALNKKKHIILDGTPEEQRNNKKQIREMRKRAPKPRITLSDKPQDRANNQMALNELKKGKIIEI